MKHEISNIIYKSWHDFLGIMFFSPVATMAFSAFIFFWCFKVLSINAKRALLGQQIWKIFVSLYFTSVWWGLIFVACLFFVIPKQILKGQSALVRQFQKNLVVQNLPKAIP